MQPCPLLRTFNGRDARQPAVCRMSQRQRTAQTQPAPQTPGSQSAGRWLLVVAALSRLIGWRALENLLDAIPDSNDDFGLF
ncbi:hypothetical protein SAMN06265784_11239 [Paraburkholderia susongensis]|uniref:Uncharacterized protein n=2 Tax=Paraburkholderia susongensis TaxID=1515439 RepID=A0A1X7LYA8_9BURK|nr:hypothetical protein SAMN06265784_11239 [Paraburkholderia susongensis]